MEDIIVLINQAGPLPISIQFKAPADGQLSFFLSGSGWTESANTWIQVGLEMDGQPLGVASMFANNTFTHMPVIPVYIPVNLTFGEHTLTLAATNSTTITDENDFFHVSLHL